MVQVEVRVVPIDVQVLADVGASILQLVEPQRAAYEYPVDVGPDHGRLVLGQELLDVARTKLRSPVRRWRSRG